MHFSREKLKEQAGWIILGFVILVALGFWGLSQLTWQWVYERTSAASEAAWQQADGRGRRWRQGKWW